MGNIALHTIHEIMSRSLKTMEERAGEIKMIRARARPRIEDCMQLRHYRCWVRVLYLALIGLGSGGFDQD